MIVDYLKISFLMMRSKPVRSGLSLLGIYIGVLALVVILAIREGVSRQLNDLFSTSGARVVFVHPGYDRVSKKIGRLGPSELERLKAIPAALSVQARTLEEIQVRTEKSALRAKVAGIDDQFVAVYRIPLLRGRTFLSSEVTKKQPVCLVSAEAAEKLFPMSDPIGSTLEIGAVAFQVIGVAKWTVEVSQRTSLNDTDVLVPFGWVSRGPNAVISAVEVRMRPELTGEEAIHQVKLAISRGDVQRENMYFVRSLEQYMEKAREFNNRVLGALLGIAAISLLVGGIGVANVMITAVTERTREVGVRKALGARRMDILAQFMVESSVLCATGGVLAVLTGTLGINLLPTFIKIETPLAIPAAPVIGCLALTIAIGVLAGVYPASRAAGLSPAEALRYE